MDKDNEMKLISKVSEETGVPVDTIRNWGKRGQLSAWEARPTITGKAYYTTSQAVTARNAIRSPRGRPRKK